VDGSSFVVIELCHQFPGRVPGGAEVVVAGCELRGDVDELLFRSPLWASAEDGGPGRVGLSEAMHPHPGRRAAR